MRRLAVLTLVLSSAAAAGADGPDGDGPDADSDPAPTQVRVRMVEGVARLTAHYAFAVEGPIYSSQHLHLELPATAVVTGATAARDGRAHRLALVPTAHGAARFDALTGESSRGALPSGLLIEGGPGGVDVSIASPHRGRLALTLEATAPTCFFRDARYVRVPDRWAAVAPMALRARVRAVDALDAQCNPHGHDGTWLAFAQPSLSRRRSGDRLGVFAARLDAGDQHVVRVELDVAGTLGDVPRDLSTVLVVDGSRSLSAGERDAQRAVVASYLAQARDTPIQVIAFARHAQPVLPGWTAASRARERVDHELRALAPRNGSNFDRGLKLAGTWLARVGGTRRVILITDQRMADRLSSQPADRFARDLPPGTLVHVVAATGSAAGLVRDEAGALAGLAAATGGIHVGLSGDGPVDATMLARPISVDQVVLRAPGWTSLEGRDAAMCSEDTVGEGGSCTWWGTGHAASGPVAVEGRVWGRRVVRVVRPDPGRGIELARELTGTQVDLDDKTRARVDALARAVNEHWSLFAAWGGTGRYEQGFGQLRGMSCCGNSSTSIVDHVGIGPIGTVRPPLDLTAQVAAATARCGLGEVRARVAIELTFAEIVDVRVTILGGPTSEAVTALETCIAEATWEMSPMIATPLANQVRTVTLGR